MNERASWQPTASPARLAERAAAGGAVRAFFAARGVHEVSTPVLCAAPVSDPHIASMAVTETTPTGPRHWTLRTSPEYFHKRLIAAGHGDLFELGPVFRAGDRGRWHEGEFTLLEWYRLGFSWRQLAAEAVELIRRVAEAVAQGGPQAAVHRPAAGWISCAVHWIAFRDLLGTALGLDVLTANDHELISAAQDRGLMAGEVDRTGALDYLYGVIARDALAEEAITIVHDFPPEHAALARLVAGEHGPLAERFEIYLGRLEIVNGYRELTSAIEQRHRFAADTARRRRLGLPEVAGDQALLAALDHGLPECAGAALGFDRLLAALTGAKSLAEVIAFPAPGPPAGGA